MKMKKEDREIFLKQIFWEVVGSAFIAGGIFHDTAEYTGGNIMLSSAGKTFFLQLTALYADFFSDD